MDKQEDQENVLYSSRGQGEESVPTNTNFIGQPGRSNTVFLKELMDTKDGSKSWDASKPLTVDPAPENMDKNANRLV